MVYCEEALKIIAAKASTISKALCASLILSTALIMAIVTHGDHATAGGEAGQRHGAALKLHRVQPGERAKLLPPRIEDPHTSMHHVYKRLAAAAQKQPNTVVRISVFSDSVNGWDGVTSALRHALQARFGDAGKGFVHIAPGWTYQHHRDVRWKNSGDWRTHVVNRGKGPGGRYGFGGVMAADGTRRSWATFQTTENHPSGPKVSLFRLFYQAYPGAGTVTLTVDSGSPIEIRTAATMMDDRVHELRVPDGPHSLKVEVGERGIRLYGVVMERAGPGVVVDAVALVGARVARLLRFDQPHLKRQIQLRDPDLLVFWLGGNNATSKGWNRAAFVRDYGTAIATARSGRPGASCLVASITDIGERETGKSLKRVPHVVEAQREVAKAQKCAFLNIHEAMGGPGSMDRWFHGSPRLSTPDYRHLTPNGAIRVGGFFHEALIAGYEASQSP